LPAFGRRATLMWIERIERNDTRRMAAAIRHSASGRYRSVSQPWPAVERRVRWHYSAKPEPSLTVGLFVRPQSA
jgi:hypothetical protein